MAYEHRDGQGSLFKNDRKETERHPDYTGKFMVGGKLHYLSAWLKEGSSGKFFSLALGKEVEGASSPAAGGSVPDTPQDSFEDSIPF